MSTLGINVQATQGRSAPWATEARIEEAFKLGSGERGQAAHPHQKLGVVKIMKALETGRRKFLLYYAPRTGKTRVQAMLAYVFMRCFKELRSRLVIVVNDRESLDVQSFEEILRVVTQISQNGGVWQLPEGSQVLCADTTSELRSILTRAQGDLLPRVVFTTLQKFSTDGLKMYKPTRELACNTVVMPDECHRSQGAAYTMAMERALGGSLVDGGLVYVALTGTPSPTSLELFGEELADGSLVPFHTYHLGTAISQGRVMNPMNGYTEVRALVDQQASTTQPNNDRLNQLISGDSKYLEDRVGFALDHFAKFACNLSYEAQAMFLCPSREHVVLATRFARKIARRIPALASIGPERIVGAFSQSVKIDGKRVSESNLNINGAVRTPTQAKAARLLFIDGKFETGYDNPALTVLYVFKKLQGRQATQVLLRHCGKRPGKPSPMTVDFVNVFSRLHDCMKVYYGDVAWRRGDADVRVSHECARLLQSSSSATSERAQSYKQIVNKLLLKQVGKVRHETRPVATPQACLQSTEVQMLKPRPVPRSTPQSEVVRKNVPTDLAGELLCLKLIKDPTVEGEDYEMLERVQERANSGKSPSLDALMRHGVIDAMMNVMKVGDESDRTMAFEILNKFTERDDVAKLLVRAQARFNELGRLEQDVKELVAMVEKCRSDNIACDSLEALRKLKQIGHPSGKLQGDAYVALEKFAAMVAGSPRRAFHEVLLTLGAVDTLLSVIRRGDREDMRVARSTLRSLRSFDDRADLFLSARSYLRSVKGKLPSKSAELAIRVACKRKIRRKLRKVLPCLVKVGKGRKPLSKQAHKGLSRLSAAASENGKRFREALVALHVVVPLRSVVKHGDSLDKSLALRTLSALSDVSDQAKQLSFMHGGVAASAAKQPDRSRSRSSGSSTSDSASSSSGPLSLAKRRRVQ